MGLPRASAAAAGRLPLIDATKGLACTVIVWHHLSLYGPMPEGAARLLPGLLGALSDYGRLAVQVFLVLGGYLAAASLAPQGRLRIDHPLRRILQRYARLAMPYLVALTACVLIAALVRPWFHDDTVPGPPGLLQLLAHGLLLQDLLNQEALSAGVWYVAVDFQLFTLALLALLAADAWRERTSDRWLARWAGVAVVLVVTVMSLVVFNRHAEMDDTAFYFFGSYGLGMLTYWIGRARRPGTWTAAVALLACVGGAALAVEWRSRIATALFTALLLALADRRGWLAPAHWPAPGRVLLTLGQISYSLFLIHFPVLLLVSALIGHVLPDTPWVDLAAMVATFALSVGAALLLYRVVELRRASLRAVGVLMAALLACGLLVAA